MRRQHGVNAHRWRCGGACSFNRDESLPCTAADHALHEQCFSPEAGRMFKRKGHNPPNFRRRVGRGQCARRPAQGNFADRRGQPVKPASSAARQPVREARPGYAQRRRHDPAKVGSPQRLAQGLSMEGDGAHRALIGPARPQISLVHGRGPGAAPRGKSSAPPWNRPAAALRRFDCC